MADHRRRREEGQSEVSALAIVTTALKNAPAVTNITTAAKIYPGEVPKAIAAPFLTVNLVGEPDGQLLEGAAGYPESRVQVECIGPDMDTANALGEAVKTALQSIVKQTIATRTDVDIRKDGVDFTEPATDQSYSRRLIGFYVRWR